MLSEGELVEYFGKFASARVSVNGSCRRHDVDPFAFLQDEFRRLPAYPADRIDALPPDSLFASHRRAGRSIAA